MLRDDCKNQWILRIGEMHMVMAALRAVGNFVEDSGIDDAWISADIYGPLTTRQILEAKHMKRALTAHMVTIQAVFSLYWEVLIEEYPSLQEPCMDVLQKLVSALENTADSTLVEEALSQMQSTLTSQDIFVKMEQFDSEHLKQPVFKFLRMYMEQVLMIFTYIRATRNGQWTLHLHAAEGLCKYFFAHDKLKYARMVPLYLAEMHSLEESDPDIWMEFNTGNFVVNKSSIPFCAIGADHGVEHVNRWMKVMGGLVGITLNPSARDNSF